jgi:TonB-dependent starch-binding outer membrane protein SusC
MKRMLCHLLLCFLFTTSLLAQTRHPVSGVVRDKLTGAVLPGVNVQIKGSTIGVVTDENGRYTLDVAEGATLLFHYVGHDVVEIKVTNQRSVDVTLESRASSLDQVVVVGYGTQRKADLTGSVVTADIESFRQSPNVSILQSLQGTVPGLNVGAVNAAGADPTVTIRGQITLSGSTTPLIVLDGIIYNGTMAALNPQDIESITVLKDASATAIYGSQAANGVILVQTRRGKGTGKPVINFTTSYASQTPAHELVPMNRAEFIKKDEDVEWQQAYLAPGYTQPNPNFDLTQYVNSSVGAGYTKGTDFNWWDAATNPGHIQDNQLSISGATDRSNYYISGGYTKQNGFIVNDKFSRKSVRINLETKVENWFTVGVQTFGSFTDYSGTPLDLGLVYLTSPLLAAYDSTGAFIPYPNGGAVSPFLQSVDNSFDHRNTLSGNFYAIVNIPFIKGLSYRVNYGNNYFWTQQYVSNPYAAGLTGGASKFNASEYDYTLDNIVSYKRTFHDIHHIDLTMVYGAGGRANESTTAAGSNFSNISLGYNSLQQAGIQAIASDAWQENSNYQLARLNYGLMDKYLLTGSIRRDGFSGFAANHKYGVFPSLAAAWVASNESFLHVSWLDYLKLRVSYGSNDNLTSRYSSLANVTPGAAYVFGDAGSTLFGQEVTTLANPDLKWETTTGVNFGLDFTVLKKRISGTVDYYSTVTSNLLYTVNIPTVSGFSSITTNVGQIDNHGIELSINSTVIKSGDFQWDLGLNFSRNTNRIVKLLGTGDLVSSGLFIGKSIGAVYGYQRNGFWQIGETPPAGWYTGTDKIVDVNKDGAVTPDDRVILGKAEPAYRISVKNAFTYGSFSLMVFVNSIQGGKNGYLGQNNPWEPGISATSNSLNGNWARGINYWTPSNPNAEYRVPGSVPAIDPAIYKDRSFIRLQDVTLSYHFPDKMLHHLGLGVLTVYASGNNLITWTKWKGWDPETGQGLESTGMPVLKGYNAGINISF